MDISSDKIYLAQMILATENPTILEEIKAIFKREKTDFWNTLSQKQQENIDAGIADLEAGKKILFTDYIKSKKQ